MGLFINHEGGDGSGKATQAQLTSEFLVSEGFGVGNHAFPRYDTPTGALIRQYLRGEFGLDMPRKEKAQLYANDRLAAKPEMMPFITGTNMIEQTDRFSTSNMGHLGGEILEAAARLEFYEYIRFNEFEHMGIPKPDFNFVHMIPASVSLENIRLRNIRENKTDEVDIHEEFKHLEQTSHAYAEITQLYPNEYYLINCMENHSKMRKREDIQEEVQFVLSKLL